MRTGADGVWAAGDCAEKFHRVSRRQVAIALGTYANKEGRTAGINIGGGTAHFPGVLGTAVTKPPSPPSSSAVCAACSPHSFSPPPPPWCSSWP